MAGRDSKHSFICSLTTVVLAHSGACVSMRRNREQSLQTVWVLALEPATITAILILNLPTDSVRCAHTSTHGQRYLINAKTHQKKITWRYTRKYTTAYKYCWMNRQYIQQVKKID